MPTTYEPIATTTLSSATSTFAFTSIPSTYTDLRIVLTGTVSVNGKGLAARFNSVGGTAYSYSYIYGDGTTAGSSDDGGGFDYAWFGYTAAASNTVPCLATMDIFSYTSSINKTYLSTMSIDKNGSGQQENGTGLWINTSAINRIDIGCYGFGSANLNAGMTITLFGIKAA